MVRSRRDAPPVLLHVALMVTWEIMITCRDASRRRYSELRDGVPEKGEIIETADSGQIIKSRIDAYHEERTPGARLPLFQVAATEI